MSNLSKDLLPRALRHGLLTFDQLYEDHFDYVYCLVSRLAGSADAEDLTQDVFVVVHRRLEGFEGRADIKTWLFQIAYRTVGAHIRKERLRRLLTLNLKAEVSEACAAPRSLERLEDAAHLSTALRSLSWKKRAVLILHDVEGWPCTLIAERMLVPTNTVYTRLHHARKEVAKGMKRSATRSER